MIYGDKLGLNLKNVKQKQKKKQKKKKRKGEKCIIIDDAKRRGDGEMGQSMTHGNGNRCKKGREKKRQTYLKLRLIKQYKVGDRCVLFVLRL